MNEELVNEQREFAQNEAVLARSAEQMRDSYSSFLQWKKQIGANIDSALRKRGIDYRQVAVLTQGRVLYQTVRHCLIGENFPGSRLLWQLHEEFGVTLSEVFAGC